MCSTLNALVAGHKFRVAMACNRAIPDRFPRHHFRVLASADFLDTRALLRVWVRVLRLRTGQFLTQETAGRYST